MIRLRRALARLIRSPGAFAVVLYLAGAAFAQQHAFARFDSGCACNGTDGALFMWSLGWWPHAFLHGLNPLHTDRLWAGISFNVAANTTVPLPAIVAWPVTAIWGPVVSYNLLMLSAPALNGWFAYRLCRHLTGRSWPAVVAGWLYGLSSFQLGVTQGHMQLVFTFAPPAALWLTLRRLDGLTGERPYVGMLTLVLIAQLLCGSEMLATATLVAALAVVFAWLYAPASERRELVRLAGLIVIAYVAMAVICSPYLYQLATGPRVGKGLGVLFPADLLSFVFPTGMTLIGGHSFRALSAAYPGNVAEDGTYIGIVLVLIVGAWGITAWRQRGARVLLSVLAVSVVWSLGDRLTLGGHATIALPWKLIEKAPLLDEILPVRIGQYIALLCAIAVAMWLASPGRARAGWLLALIGAAMLLPDPGAHNADSGTPVFSSSYRTPRFFTTALHRRYLARDEVIVAIPYGPAGVSLLWQARAGFSFRMAGGAFYHPALYEDDPLGHELLSGAPSLGASGLVRPFAGRHDVGAFVIADGEGSGWGPVLRTAGLTPVDVGGVQLYRVPAAWSRASVPPVALAPGCTPAAATC